MCVNCKISLLLTVVLVLGHFRNSSCRSIDLFQDEHNKPEESMNITHKWSVFSDLTNLWDIFDFDLTKDLDLDLDDFYSDSSEEDSVEKYLVCKNCTIVVRQDQQGATGATSKAGTTTIKPIEVIGQGGQIGFQRNTVRPPSEMTNMAGMEDMVSAANMRQPNAPGTPMQTQTPAQMMTSISGMAGVANMVQPNLSGIPIQNQIPAQIMTSIPGMAGAANMGQPNAPGTAVQAQTPSQMITTMPGMTGGLNMGQLNAPGTPMQTQAPAQMITTMAGMIGNSNMGPLNAPETPMQAQTPAQMIPTITGMTGGSNMGQSNVPGTSTQALTSSQMMANMQGQSYNQMTDANVDKPSASGAMLQSASSAQGAGMTEVSQPNATGTAMQAQTSSQGAGTVVTMQNQRPVQMSINNDATGMLSQSMNKIGSTLDS